MLGGSPIGEVVERFGTTWQSLHAWRKRFADHTFGKQYPARGPFPILPDAR